MQVSAWSCYVPIPSPLEDHFPIIHVSFPTTPGTSRLPWGELCWDAAPSLLAVLNWTASSDSHSWSSSRSQRSLVVSSVQGLLSTWGSLGRGWVSPLTLDRHLSTRGLTTLHGSIVCYLHGHQGLDTDPDRLTVPVDGHSKVV